jgi:hypothetical protein
MAFFGKWFLVIGWVITITSAPDSLPPKSADVIMQCSPSISRLGYKLQNTIDTLLLFQILRDGVGLVIRWMWKLGLLDGSLGAVVTKEHGKDQDIRNHV